MAAKQALPKGVEEIKRAGGRTVYRGRVRDSVTQQRYSEVFPTPAEAAAWMARRRREIDDAYRAQGIVPERRQAKRDVPRTLTVLTDRYLAQAQLSTASRSTQRTNLRCAMRFFGEDRMLTEIDRPFIREWVADMVDLDLSRGTRANRLSTLRQAFGLAVELGVVQSNPVDGVGIGQAVRDGERRLGRYPTDEEIVKLAAELPDWCRAMVFVAADSGLRRSELAGLRWRSVHLEAAVLYVGEVIDEKGVERQYTKSRGGGSGWEDKGRAYVPMSPRTIEALRELRGRREATEDDHVFRSPGKDRATGKVLWSRWDEARKAVLPPELRGVRIHDLRWVTATTLAETMPIHLVMRVMRHATPRMTHRYIATPELDDVTAYYNKVHAS